jgi:hypothetical protein
LNQVYFINFIQLKRIRIMVDYSKVGNAAAQSDDMSVTKSFERELPKEGLAFLRLIGYIETGRHEPRNPTYKPALKTMLIFELAHPKHMIDMGDKKVPQKFTLRLNKGMTSKSGYKKVFNMMNKALGGGHTHFFQMFDKPMMGDIYHNKVNAGTPDEVTYANLDNEGAYSFRSNVKEDELTGEMIEIPVPPRVNDLQGFLWENSTTTDEDYVAMWDGLFIEGEREVLDKKTKEKAMKSKNWIQEAIMENMEWEGSTCQALTQEHISLDSLDDLETGSVDLAGAAESAPVQM